VLAGIGGALLALVALLVAWGNRPSPSREGTVAMPELQTGPARDEQFLAALGEQGLKPTSQIQAKNAAIAYCTSMIDGAGFIESMRRITELDPSLGPTEAVKFSQAAEIAYCPSAALAGAPR
jgi:hypothetical protein